MQKDQLKQPTTKVPAPCFIKAIPFKPRNNLQPGKILFQARKRPYNGRKDRRIINNTETVRKAFQGAIKGENEYLQSLSVRGSAKKQVFAGIWKAIRLFMTGILCLAAAFPQ